MSAEEENGAVEAFIEKWAASSGAERANYQLFLVDLCHLLGVEEPRPAVQENRLNDYVFERSVSFKHPNGTQSSGFIDLYKRNCFVLEAKQSAKRVGLAVNRDDAQMGLLPEDATQVKTGTARRGTKSWDAALVNARRQAEDYAKALPREHGWPPFLIVADVGHCIELYADFARQGKNYAQFPDRRSYRIMLEDLRDKDVRERLRLVWTDPLSLDPARKSAEVTRDIAERLAKVAKTLEARGNNAGSVAEFLMRCLFTMFAEDVRLLPEGAFTNLLQQMKDTPDKFRFAMEDLWKAMNAGGYTGVINEVVKRFNGGLFANPTALDLDADEIHELWVAAKRDWKDVEPAIFGTLLERALDDRERHKLGAHYTPRAYVERLVVPTIIDPLTDDWKNAQAEAEQLLNEGKENEARDAVRGFHQTLCQTRVLDPACGTGNFLYVSMELMKRLEGEVLDYLESLGESQYLLELSGHTIDPHQFLGLEINPRAVQIADLVLWIGFLKWQIRTGGQAAISEPVLKAFNNIKEQDAVLAYDGRELLRDEDGKPVTRWDGHTTKTSPVTGEDVPDETARIETYRYSNPRPADWPETDFIVGNPPFLGDKRMKEALGGGYVDALRHAYSDLPGSIDFVMYWWHKAAALAETASVRRFGFITTNTVVQTFNRQVLNRHLLSKSAVSIVFAIPDHPWVDPEEGASVRIAMTVAQRGDSVGTLMRYLNDDRSFDEGGSAGRLISEFGKISGSLHVGAQVSLAAPLMANRGVACNGMMLSGRGFILSDEEAATLRQTPNGKSLIRPYKNGTELIYGSQNRFIIDATGWTAEELSLEAPAVYQHLADYVKPVREQNNRKRLREVWFEFAEPRRTFRPALAGLQRYVGTTETAKHRVFQFLDKEIVPDHMVVAVALEEGHSLAILSSRFHVAWALRAGGRLGVGNDPRYQKSVCFDPFPFPDPDEPTKLRLRELGERLDAFRKERQAEHPDLTMTGMYNVLERLRELDADPSAKPLDDKEKAIHEKGLVSVLRQIHDEIDAAVFDAYGWPHDLSEEEILERLVALNRERAEEERRGQVRWLRPDYQIPKFGKGLETGEQVEAEMDVPAIAAQAPKWPSKLPEQIRLVREELSRAQGPMAADEISKAFKGGRKRAEKVTELLESLAMLGQVRKDEGRYFMVERG